MYDEVYKGFEEERERLYEKMKKIDFEDEKYEMYFKRLKELQALISEQRQIEREDKRVESECYKLRDEELKKAKIRLDPNKMIEAGVFAAIAILALIVEVNGDILKFDSTKNLLKMNRL